MKTVEIVVLQTSDIHGQILPVNYALNKELGSGMTRLAHMVSLEREKNPNVLLIDNGDLIQGTPFAYYYAKVEPLKTNPIILTANLMKYDCAVLGNHEFNYGLETLDRTVAKSEFPWLSANIINDETGEPYFGKPYIIKTMEDGIRVAVLGLTTSYIPNWESPKHIEGLQFISATEAAKQWVPILRGMADVVIVSYHGGFERNLDTSEPTEMLTGENEGYQLCEEVPEIDILLSGHQHRELSGKTVNGVPILQPGSKGSNIGKAVIRLKKNRFNRWGIIDRQTELIRAGSSFEPEFLQQLQPYEEKVQKWLDKPIGRVLGDMTVHDPMAIRLKDSPLIRFINEVQMEAAGTKISNTALFSDDAPGFLQDVTMRDVMANYIYPNTLKVLRISGRDILEALEQSATYFEQYDGCGEFHVNKAFCDPKPQHYNYDMWAGIDYELDISQPAGQRVVKLKYKNRDLEMDALFDVVMNNYRAGGGGNYFMYVDKPVVREIQIDVSELIANYFLKHGTVQVKPANGWRVIY